MKPMTWIEWFCSLPGNEDVCIIPQEFIRIPRIVPLPDLGDQFNLYGLKKVVENYQESFDVLTGVILGSSSIDSLKH